MDGLNERYETGARKTVTLPGTDGTVSGTAFACATIFFKTASLCSSDCRAGPEERATLSESARMNSWPCSASSSTLLVVRS